MLVKMLVRRVLLGLGLVLVGGFSAWAQRLPGGVRPEHYSLTIAPDLKAATFAGNETIEVVLDAPTSAITLNAADLEFGLVKAYQGDSTSLGKQPHVATVELDPAKEQATFHFAAPLPAGAVTLQIAFTGILNNKLRGFYLSRTKLQELRRDTV